MDTVLATVAIGIVVFASTNIDEILLLSAFFVDPQLRPRAIVAGQFLGIGVLVLASAGAALAAMVVPKGWIALLGFIPLALGLRRLFALRRSQPDALELDQVQNREQRIVQRTHSQVPAVAVVTIANGGDNLGVYIPLFSERSQRDPGLHAHLRHHDRALVLDRVPAGVQPPAGCPHPAL